MPIYEYVCSMCGCQFELLRPVSKSTDGADCPRCKSASKRKLSGFATFGKSSDGNSYTIGGGGGCSSCSSSGCSTCGH